MQHEKKKRIWLGIFLLLLLAIAGLYWRGATNDSRNALQKVIIAQTGDFFLYAPLYVALDAGLFRERGIDASLVSTGGDEKTWAAVISGSASFGVADPAFIAIADTRGQSGRVIANIVNGVPFWGITWRQEIPEIKTPGELAPFAVATFPSPSTAYTLQKQMFAQAGLPPNIREGAFGTLQAMAKSGLADIVLELEPNVSQAVITDGARVVYGMADTYGAFAITGLTTTPELLMKQPKLASDVVCSLQLALDFIRQRPDETLQLLTQRFPEISPAVAEAALARVVQSSIVPETVTTSPDAWAKTVNLRVETGDLAAVKPMDQYVDNRLAQEAELNCRLH